MKKYIQYKIHLSEEVANEIERMVNYRNSRLLLDNEEKKPRSVEEFIKGSVMQIILWLKGKNPSISGTDLNSNYKLNNRFKELMIKRNWKQKQLADLSGIDPGNISKILSNENQPSLDNFLKLWFTFDCPPLDEVLYREE